MTLCRSLATSVVLCAAGVGTFLVAPLAQAMLDTWGWRGAMRGLAALTGVSIIIIIIMVSDISPLCSGPLHPVWRLHGPAPQP